jgi:hypothetical protein
VTGAPPLTFDALRQAAIAHAQEASSELWTDFNLHDPGVTLLEQTVFALTELGYRADLPIRDLLTEADGRIDHAALALAPADACLRSAPVTRRDLELCLGALPEAARVTLRPDGRAGLLAARVVPQEGVASEASEQAVRRAFAALRPLCTDLARVEIGAEVPAVLRGRLVVGHRALPERVAAAVWLRVALLLRGMPLAETAGEAGQGATRADAADDPMRIEGDAPAPGHVGRAAHLAALRTIPDLVEIAALDLSDREGRPFPDFQPPGEDSYLALDPLAPEGGLRVVQDGAEVPLDHARLAQEIGRLRAGLLAAVANRRDPADWAPPPDGRHRRLDYVPVNATLPSAYRRPPGSAEARQIAGYRSLIDAALAAATADLAHLPALFSGDAARLAANASAPPDLALRNRLAGPAHYWAEAAARHDRRHARAQRVLELLTALQGEEMPAEGRSRMDRDRPAGLRPLAALRRRERFLRALPDLHRRRGTGPDGAEPGGVLGKLLCLADLLPAAPDAPLAALARAGLELDPQAETASVPRDAIGLPDDPLDLLVPERPAPAGDYADLAAEVPCLASGRIAPALLHAAALPESWLAAPEGLGWRLLIDTGAGALHDAGSAPDRDAAVARANALREAFAALNRACEGAWLVEDILLRGQGTDFAPHRATLVLAGWSLRASDPAYRRHVARMIDRCAPAHCRIAALWLDPAAMADFARLHAAWQDDPTAARALRAFLAGAGTP